MTKAAKDQQTRSSPRGPAKTRTRSGRESAKREPASAKSRTPKPDLQIVQTQVFRGPNYWSYEPCIRMLVDLGSLEEWPSNQIPGFNEALLALLPGVAEHSCSLGRSGGFGERLVDGTWLGHVAEHVALELQRETGAHISRGKTRSAGETGRYNVIYGYWEETVGAEAGKLAVRIVNHAVKAEKDFDFLAELERLIKLAERRAFGPSTQAIIDEAASRDIPWMRLNEGSLIQLGQGKYQQRIRATMTSMTSAVAVDIASDKKMTNQLLAAAGLPVPRSEVVRSADEAVEAAGRIGYPVVTKPLDGNHGRGVGLNLSDQKAIRAGFEHALGQSRDGRVVVETFVRGNDYRVLVVGGRMVAIAEREPAHVVGDGEHTIRELVEITNQDPRRGIGHEKVLTRITVDNKAEEFVRSQGFALDDVPAEGERVLLVATGNMSTGGISIDRTFEAHEDNIEIAEEAARVVGLDVAGIDFLAPDITLPVRETGGAIVEVNAAPGFRMHTHPTEGEPQYVAKPVIDALFPQNTPSRIPIVAVTGLEREDHHHADDRPHLPRTRPQDRHDLDRRRLHRRAAREAGRRLGSEIGADGAAEPEGRHGGVRGRPRRDPPGGSRLRPQRRRRRAERHGRPPGAARRRDAGAARRGEAGGRRGGPEDRLGRAERRRSVGARDAPAYRRAGDPVLDEGEARARGSVDPTRTQGDRPRARSPRRADGAQGGADARRRSPTCTCCRRRSTGGRG